MVKLVLALWGFATTGLGTSTAAAKHLWAHGHMLNPGRVPRGESLAQLQREDKVQSPMALQVTKTDRVLQWCPGSKLQSCTQICPDISCEVNQCAMREDNCCQLTCKHTGVALLDVAEREATAIAKLLPHEVDLMPQQEVDDLLEVSRAASAMFLMPALAGGVLAGSLALDSKHGSASSGEEHALAQFPISLPASTDGGGSAKSGGEVDVTDPDPVVQFMAVYQMSFLSTVISGLIYSLLIGIVAVFYYHEKAFPPAQDAAPHEHFIPDGDWRFGLCSCCEDPAISCLVLFCAPIRWADTMFMAGFLQFHVALLLMVGLIFVNSVIAGTGSIVLLAMLVYYRQKLRAKFQIPRGSCGSVCGDFCTYCWCMCCAIVQEARQIEEAYQAKHPAVTQFVP